MKILTLITLCNGELRSFFLNQSFSSDGLKSRSFVVCLVISIALQLSYLHPVFAHFGKRYYLITIYFYFIIIIGGRQFSIQLQCFKISHKRRDRSMYHGKRCTSIVCQWRQDFDKISLGPNLLSLIRTQPYNNSLPLMLMDQFQLIQKFQVYLVIFFICTFF